MVYPANTQPTRIITSFQISDCGAKEGARVQSEVLAGKPANKILRYADENNVSIITMASRGP